MALSDAQIERFSRQIVLPQVGAAGQQRLLAASIAVAGAGEGLDTAAAYLTGAGVGHLILHARSDLAAALRAIDPDVKLTLSALPLGSVAADVLVACDVEPTALDRAAAVPAPLVAGAAANGRGWLVVSEPGGACASCAARQPADHHPPLQAGGGFESIAAGVVGSLLALEALKVLLGIGGVMGYRAFDAATGLLAEPALTAASDCPRCAR